MWRSIVRRYIGVLVDNWWHAQFWAKPLGCADGSAPLEPPPPLSRTLSGGYHATSP